MASISESEFDHVFKLLMIGDSGVGKTTLLSSFISDQFEEPATGGECVVKHVTIGGKKLKLAISDTAGKERFRTLTSSCYSGAQGIIMVYDVTRRDTFTYLSEAMEIDPYSTNQNCIKMLVGNKVDKESERAVTKKEGIDFAKEYGCLFIECSAKTRVNVEQCFEELVLKILDTLTLTAEGSTIVKKNIFDQKAPQEIQSLVNDNKAPDLETEISRLQHALVLSKSDSEISSMEVVELKRLLKKVKSREREISDEILVLEKENFVLRLQVKDLVKGLKESESRVLEFEKENEGFEKDELEIGRKSDLKVLLKKSERKVRELEDKMEQVRKGLEVVEKINSSLKEQFVDGLKVDWPLVAATTGAVAVVVFVYFCPAKFGWKID